LQVAAYRLNAAGSLPNASSTSAVDTQGRFTLEGLVAGDYELRLTLYAPYVPGTTPQPPTVAVTQKVTVSSGAETPVTLTFNLTAKDKEAQP
jgi:hypothetical protein